MQRNNLIPIHANSNVLPLFIRSYYPETIRGVQDFFDDMVGLFGDGFNPDTEGVEYIDYQGKLHFTTDQGLLIDLIMANCRDTCRIYNADIYDLALQAINNPKK